MKQGKDTITRGILLVDKPKGLTSHDVVYRIRRKFEFKKVGHTGTLDPMATGLLVILIGKEMTRRSQELSADDKTYEAVFTFGIETDSADAMGTVISQKTVDITDKDIVNILERFKGEISQVPPMFSAKKHKGKKLYEYAREGQTVKVEPKKVVIYKFEADSFNLPEVSFTVKCSKGTFIRQLAADIGKELGCGAHLSALRRTQAGEYDIKDSIALDKILEMSKDEIVGKLITI
ncbi:MAG: tRNA pseudouridine(55) synthase TruB [Candidatus Omnitrophica bacterium]|nr:tRNA pseudouridine(55) synthase TruB [Candidatus Omnitrophota bacterium]